MHQFYKQNYYINFLGFSKTLQLLKTKS